MVILHTPEAGCARAKRIAPACRVRHGVEPPDPDPSSSQAVRERLQGPCPSGSGLAFIPTVITGTWEEARRSLGWEVSFLSSREDQIQGLVGWKALQGSRAHVPLPQAL